MSLRTEHPREVSGALSSINQFFDSFTRLQSLLELRYELPISRTLDRDCIAKALIALSEGDLLMVED